MIVKIDFLNELKNFGLNTYEAKIWCALLSRGVSTAGELSDIAAIPRSRSYDVLESLERKGFIITKLGKPFKYLAVSPSEVVERVKKNIRENAEKEIKNLENVKETELLKELNLLHSQGIEDLDSTEFSGYIKSRSSLHSQISNMINNANNNIIICSSFEELLEKSKSIIEPLKEARKRNVSIQILLSTKGDEDKLKQFKEIAKIKNHEIKNRFTMIDNKQILMMLKDENSIHPMYDTGVWMDSEFLVNSLTDMFKHVWDKAKDL